jgi:hypothetical protein
MDDFFPVMPLFGVFLPYFGTTNPGLSSSSRSSLLLADTIGGRGAGGDEADGVALEGDGDRTSPDNEAIGGSLSPGNRAGLPGREVGCGTGGETRLEAEVLGVVVSTASRSHPASCCFGSGW